ncbi:MAG: sigma-70 family RNA polymerase sigma factor, partial [Clostridia bacterium]|nr:sigma-70 family RNA polymerase sigma factor [Clostridia bacterium]
MKIQPLRTDGCFEEVMEKYSDMVYRIAYANVRVKTDAEDAFQEVWCRYYQKNKV